MTYLEVSSPSRDGQQEKTMQEKSEFIYVEFWHSHDQEACRRYGLSGVTGLRAPPHDHDQKPTWNTYWNRVHESELARLSAAFRHVSCYRTLNYYSLPEEPDDEELNLALFDLGLDFDCAEDPKKAFADAARVGRFLEEIGIREGEHYIPEFSGSKGAAIRIPHQFLGQTPKPALTGFGNHMICKSLAGRLAKAAGVTTLDDRIYSKRRQWRITGTVHLNTGLFRTQLLLKDLERPLEQVRGFAGHRGEIEVIETAQLKPNPTLNAWYEEERKKMEAADAERARRRSRARGTAKRAETLRSIESPPPCVAEALIVGVTPRGEELGTNRNDVTLQLATFCKDADVDEDDAVEILVEHAQDVLAPFSSSGPAEIEASTRSCVKAVYSGDYEFSCAAMRKLEFTCEPSCGLQRVDLGELTAPQGYAIAESGVYRVMKDREDDKEMKIIKGEKDGDDLKVGSRLVKIASLPMWIGGRFVSEQGEVRLGLRCGGRTFVVDRDAAVIPRRMADRLANLDLPVDGMNLKELSAYLARFEEVNRDRFPRRRLVTRCGWHGARFVLPGMKADEQLEPPGPGEMRLLKALRSEGELSAFQDAVDKLRPSPKAMALVWASVAAPMLHLMRCPSFAVHSYYESSAGKTVVQEVAAAIWGDPRPSGGLVQTWNATVVGLEQRAGFCSDLPLLLSELRTMGRDRDIERTIYMLVEGQGRTRGDRSGGTRVQQSWRTVVISTGETSITAASPYTGPAVRVLELYGNLLGHLDGDAVVEVERVVRSNFGMAGIKLIEALTTDTFVRDIIPTEYDRWRRILATEVDTPFGHRMGAYCAALAVAADILHNVVLDDEIGAGEIKSVVVPLLRDEAYEKSVPYAERALDLLDSWVSENESHFDPGVRQQFGRFTRAGVAFLPHVLQRACEELGIDFSRVKKDFDERGWFDKEAGRLTKTVRIGENRSKAYVVNPIKRAIRKVDDDQGGPPVTLPRIPWQRSA